MKKFAAVILILLMILLCGCAEKDTRKKVGLGIAADTEGITDALPDASGNMEVYAAAALVVLDSKNNVIDSRVDAVRMRVAVDSDGCILYAEGTPESSLGKTVPKELSDRAIKEASERAQYIENEELNDPVLRLFADFSESHDACKTKDYSIETGLADAVLYAGYTFEEDGRISLAGLCCKDYRIEFDNKGQYMNLSEENILVNESIFFADHCIGKTKEEVSLIGFDYPSGKPDTSELLRYCNTNIMPFIYVIGE